MSPRAPVLQEHPLTPATVVGAIWRYSPAHPKLFHLHGQLEMLVVKRGRVVERIGDRHHTAHARQLLWHLPGLPHQQVEASSNLDLRVVHVEPDLVPQLSKLSAQVAGSPVVELTQRDFDALMEECEEPSTVENDELVDRSVHLPRLVEVALRATQTHHDDVAPTNLAQLACWLLRDDPSLSREALCSLLDCSGAHLSRCFVAELGTTLQEQRARLRIVEFLRHAVRERHNWLQAALLAGFGSYSQFHRVFVRIAGMSPRRYLNQGGRNWRALLPA